MFPYENPSLISKGLSFLKTIKWGSIIDGTSKTLGVINQAIPVIYQVKPILDNTKTMFKIANIVNTPTTSNTQTKKEDTTISTNNSPIFYI